MNKTVLLYYFSGTGNAFHLAQNVSKNFESLGYSVIVSNVEKVHPEHQNAQYIGIISSIYGFGLPDLMRSFLNKIPAANNTKAFVFLAIGNPENVNIFNFNFAVPPSAGWGIDQSCYLLKSKGYKIANAYAISMPNNWILVANPPPQVQIDTLYADCEKNIEVYVNEIVGRVKNIQRVSLFWCYLMFAIYCVFLFFSRRIMGKLFTVNSNSCTSCKLCHRLCPSCTIKWKHDKPYWGWDCQQCFRCINICPTQAIEVSNLTLLVSLVSMFLFDYPSRFLSHFFRSNRVFEFVFDILFWFFIFWLTHLIQLHPTMNKLVPSWFATKNRRRYFGPLFKEKLIKQQTKL